MKLLIVTQVIDKNHPILGFFHRWVEEFSKHFESIEVICLEKGKFNLPKNVKVHSLGKEAGKGRLNYLFRFYKLSWQLRREYDQVFVHMNQIYVILGTPVWCLLRKKVGLWYAHGAVSPSLRRASKLVDFIFTSTAEGLKIDTDKKIIVGQGIDTDIFKTAPKPASDRLRLITVGRISSAKNISTLLEACAILQKAGVNFEFKIVGTPITEEEGEYDIKMKKLVSDLDLESKVIWSGAVANHELPALLQQSDIFIHDGATNSLDKALLEASLCGCIVVSSNPAYRAVTSDIAPDYLYEPRDAGHLAGIVIELNLDSDKSERIRKRFSSQFNISNLISGIVGKY